MVDLHISVRPAKACIPKRRWSSSTRMPQIFSPVRYQQDCCRNFGQSGNSKKLSTCTFVSDPPRRACQSVGGQVPPRCRRFFDQSGTSKTAVEILISQETARNCRRIFDQSGTNTCVQPPDHAAVALIKVIASNKKTAVAIWMPLMGFS